jgi:hypothetical protein
MISWVKSASAIRPASPPNITVDRSILLIAGSSKVAGCIVAALTNSCVLIRAPEYLGYQHESVELVAC